MSAMPLFAAFHPDMKYEGMVQAELGSDPRPNGIGLYKLTRHLIVCTRHLMALPHVSLESRIADSRHQRGIVLQTGSSKQ